MAAAAQDSDDPLEELISVEAFLRIQLNLVNKLLLIFVKLVISGDTAERRALGVMNDPLGRQGGDGGKRGLRMLAVSGVP